MSIDKYELDITGATTAYLRLLTYSRDLRKTRSVPLNTVMGAYKGPYVVFDFDLNDVLVGIEIVGDDEPEEDHASRSNEPG